MIYSGTQSAYNYFPPGHPQHNPRHPYNNFHQQNFSPTQLVQMSSSGQHPNDGLHPNETVHLGPDGLPLNQSNGLNQNYHQPHMDVYANNTVMMSASQSFDSFMEEDLAGWVCSLVRQPVFLNSRNSP